MYVLERLLNSDGFIEKSSKRTIEHHYFDSIFVGSIYILKMILPVLTTISKCFQAGVVSFAKIIPTLQYAKEQLKQIATNQTPITVLTGTMLCFNCNVRYYLQCNFIRCQVKISVDTCIFS